MGAIENPTRSAEDSDQQESYIVETDPTDGQQVSKWENSRYQEEEIHPAKEGGIDYQSWPWVVDGFYTNTAMGMPPLFERTTVSTTVARRFIDFFRNPGSSPAYHHLDPVATAAYLTEENILNEEDDPIMESKIRLTGNSIEYVVAQ